MVILGAVFNALTITKPIKELLVGVKNIAAGNFKQRIELPLGGELGELISSFNYMAERLARYEEQNIEELTAEKAKLETLVSTIADGAVLIDTNLQVMLANPTAKRIFSWEGKEVIGENVLHYLPNEVKMEISEPLQEVIAKTGLDKGDGHVDDSYGDGGEFRITLNSPHERTVRILLTRVLDQYRESVKGLAITVQDITREVE
jgi:two-component system sensor histidine kinase NblS